MVEQYSALEVVKLVFRGLIPIVFLVIGFLVFTSDVAGWSLVLGLPLLLFGIVFLLYTYDEVIKREIKPLTGQLVKCSLCKGLTPRLPRVKPADTICGECQIKIKKNL